MLDVSAYLIEEIGDVGRVEQLRTDWGSQLLEGATPRESQDADPRRFQSDVEEITGLSEELQCHPFYVPGIGGVVRLSICVSRDREPRIYLADSGVYDEVKERFNEISGK